MTTYFSKVLREHFPLIADALNSRLECKEIDTDNLWVRDAMPIKIGHGFVKFQYKRNTKYPQLEVDPSCWFWTNPRLSDIYLDGGNVVQDMNTVFMTEIVFKNNPKILRADLEQFLNDIFGKRIIYLPVEPGDDLGHADGIIRIINGKTVLINDYSSIVSQSWYEYSLKLERILTESGFVVKKLPWIYPKRPKMSEEEFRKQFPFGDEWNDGWGYYINAYRTEGFVFMPAFNISDDAKCRDYFSNYYHGNEIVPVDCSELSRCGGLLNCVVWED